MSRGPLLVLGADSALARACRDLGVPAIRAFGPWEKDYVLRATPAGPEDVFVEDPARPELVIAALGRAGFADLPFAGVCVTSDAYIGAAGLLRSVLCPDGGRPSEDARSWMLHKDKLLQKRAISSAGIAVTPHAVIDDVWEPGAGADWTSFPAVLKPVAEQGSVGVRHARDRTELDRALAEARAKGDRRTHLIEVFVDGTEVHCDGVVSSGELRFLSVGVYDVTCMAAASGRVLSARLADPLADSQLYASAGRLARSVLPAISLNDGVFHLEAFVLQDGTLRFSECGARLGGAGVPDAVAAKFGVDLRRAYVQTELGLPLDITAEVRPGVFGWAVLPMPSGRLVAVPDAEELRALPGVIYADIRRPVGVEISSVKVSSTYGLGTVVIGASDERERIDKTRAIIDWSQARTGTVAVSGSQPPPAFMLWRGREAARV